MHHLQCLLAGMDSEGFRGAGSRVQVRHAYSSCSSCTRVHEMKWGPSRSGRPARTAATHCMGWPAGYWPAGFWPAGYWPAGYWPAGFWPAGYWPAGFVILNHTLHLVVPPPLTPPFPTRPAVCWRLAKVVLDVGSPAGAPPCPRGRAAACVCAPGCCRCVACYGHEVCCPARLKAHQRCLAEHIGKPDGGGSSSSS